MATSLGLTRASRPLAALAVLLFLACASGLASATQEASLRSTRGPPGARAGEKTLPWDLIKAGKVPTLVVGGQVGAQVGSDSRLVDRLRTRRNARLAEDAELGMQEGDLATGRSLSNVFDWLSDIWDNIRDKVLGAWGDFLASPLVQNFTEKLENIGLQISSSAFYNKVGEAIERLEEAVQVDFEIPDFVDSIIDGLKNSTRAETFVAYMKNELSETFDMDLLEELVNGTIEELNLRTVAEHLNLDQVEGVVNKIVRKFRSAKRKGFFVEAIKEEIEGSFDKIGDVIGDVGEALEDLGDFAEGIGDFAEDVADVAEDAFVSVRGVTKKVLAHLKNSTLLDIDVEAMFKKLMDKIEQIDIDLDKFDWSVALKIVEYVFDLVKERGLNIDQLLQDAVQDLVQDLQSPNSSVADLIGEVDDEFGDKIQSLLDKVNSGDYADLKLWSKLSVFAEIFGVREILFSDAQASENYGAVEVGGLSQTFEDYNAEQANKPTKLIDYLRAIFEVFLATDSYSRPKAMVKCVVGFPTKPIPCFSVLVDLIVHAKEMKWSDVLSLVMDSFGLLFGGGKKYDVPVTLKENNYLEKASLVFGMKVKIPGGGVGLKEKALKALIEILAQKTKIPSAKVFLQTLLYQVTSKWEVRAAKEGGQPGEIMDYGEVYYDSQKKESIRQAFAQAMNVPASGLKIDEVAQSARRRLVLRSLLQAQDPPVVTFTKTLSPDGLSGMSQEGSPGSELQGPADFGSFVQADAFDYVADLQLTAESVDISAELTGSTGGGVVMAVTSQELNDALAAYDGVDGVSVTEASSRVGEEGQYRRDNAINLEAMYPADSGNVKTGSSGGDDSGDQELIMIAGGCLLGVLVASSVALFVLRRQQQRKDGAAGNKPPSKTSLADKVALTPSYPAAYRNSLDDPSFRGSVNSMGDPMDRDPDLSYDSPGRVYPVMNTTAPGATTRVMNPVFVV